MLSTTAINFGSVGLSNTTNRGSLFIQCNGGFSEIQLSTGSSNNNLQREMIGQEKNDKLKYNIYTNATHPTIIGAGTNGTTHPLDGFTNGRTFSNGTSIGRPVYGTHTRPTEFYLYGKVNDNQFVTPDTYADEITITVTY